MTTAEKRKIWTEGYNQNKEAFDARIKAVLKNTVRATAN